jgi:hypothetical protein
VKRFVPPGAGIALSLLLCMSLALTGCSREEPAAEEFAALETEFNEAMSDVESNDAYQEIIKEFNPRYETLAATYWGTEGAFNAKLWLMGMLGMEEDEETRNAALEEMTDALFKRYFRSQLMAEFANLQSMYSEDLRAKYFTDLQENSPHATVRAAVIYAAARNADFEIAYGDEDVDKDTAGKLRRENLDLLIADYHDVPLRNSTYGAAAEAMLSAHDPADLEIGKPAPEIIGTNVDGEEMRLSDFRGKVLVLDFWGDW